MTKHLVEVLAACSKHTETCPSAPARNRRPALLVPIPSAPLGCCTGADLLGPCRVPCSSTLWDNRLWQGYAHYSYILEEMSISSAGSLCFPHPVFCRAPAIQTCKTRGTPSCHLAFCSAGFCCRDSAEGGMGKCGICPAVSCLMWQQYPWCWGSIVLACGDRREKSLSSRWRCWRCRPELGRA